jgi:hypothetical protein
MNKHIFHYAIVRFAPFVETEEFANVGLILACPVQGKFWYKLQSKRYRRITRFFEDIDSKLYLATVNNVKKEFERIQNVAMTSDVNITEIFKEIVRPRETIVKFSETRIVLGKDGQLLIDELFQHYVERSFLTKDYKEAAMERSVKSILKQNNLAAHYNRQMLSDGIYEASFPFVSENRTKIIKPLHLTHEKPSQVFDHGMSWLNKVDELRERGVIKNEVLFTVDEPQPDSKVHSIYETLIERFEKHDINVALYEDRDKIIEFAQ